MQIDTTIVPHFTRWGQSGRAGRAVPQTGWTLPEKTDAKKIAGPAPNLEAEPAMLG